MKFNIKKFYFEDGLYLETEIDKTNFKDIYELIYYSGKIDAYCPKCGKETIFEARPIRPKNNYKDSSVLGDEISNFADFKKNYDFNHFVNTDFNLYFDCVRRNYSHKVYFIVRIEQNKIFKIGQFPSTADLTRNFSSNNYQKVLPKLKIRELNKAIGLNSHGIGIGAFVYLRRIFEYLIEETHQLAKTQIDNWDEEKYIEAKMNRRIEMLKEYLPQFLVKNKKIYGILSKGIHELEEEHCKEIFPILKSSIELILDEKNAKLEKEKKIKETEKLLSKIARNITNT